MRAAGISEFGGAVGRIDLPDPRPLADDEVLIEIRAAGVGNWEEFVRMGDWDVGRAPPMALGVEAAGTITAIGESVEDWKRAARGPAIPFRRRAREPGRPC